MNQWRGSFMCAKLLPLRIDIYHHIFIATLILPIRYRARPVKVHDFTLPLKDFNLCESILCQICPSKLQWYLCSVYLFINLEGSERKYSLQIFLFRLLLGFSPSHGPGTVFIFAVKFSYRFSGPQNLLLSGFCEYFP